MTFYLSLVVALAATFTAGWFLHAWHARNRQAKARGGMLPTPVQIVDRWNFPKAPKLYDYEAGDDFDAPNYSAGEAGDGDPLIPDPTVAPLMDATVRALDPHSRRVPAELPGETQAQRYVRLKPGKAQL